MNVVSIIGGLGNQLFQYAFYLALKKNSDASVKLDISRFKGYSLHNGYELEKIFKIDAEYCSSQEALNMSSTHLPLIKKIFKRYFFSTSNEIIEKDSQKFIYHSKLLSFEDTIYSGYWQSYKYFEGVDSEIKKKLVFPTIQDEKNISTLRAINEKESVSIHVRRGDYVNHPKFGGICEKEYYFKAIKQIIERVKKPSFFIFSNDIEWCKKNLDLHEGVYVNWNENELSYIDLQLMASCKHNIIANSSFSWWGGYLNPNVNKIVIHPKRWTNINDKVDLFLPNWIAIS